MSHKKALTSLEKKLKSLNETLAPLNEELTTLKEKLSTLEKRKKTSHGEISNYQYDIKNLQGKIRSIKSEINTIQSKKETIKTVLNDEHQVIKIVKGNQYTAHNALKIACEYGFYDLAKDLLTNGASLFNQQEVAQIRGYRSGILDFPIPALLELAVKYGRQEMAQLITRTLENHPNKPNIEAQIAILINTAQSIDFKDSASQNELEKQNELNSARQEIKTYLLHEASNLMVDAQSSTSSPSRCFR